MHIDNFIPCAKFDLTDPQQQMECFSWMNLRIMLASENISKNAKLSTKQEHINHVNMCIQFSELVKQELNDSFQNQFSELVKQELNNSCQKQLFLLHFTSLRFWDECL